MEFLVEYIKKSEKLTVKELDERFDGDYERAIDVLGLSKENWAEFVGEFGKIVEKKTFNKVSEVEEEIGAELPEDIRYDSGSNGYDMFWKNYFNIVSTPEGEFLVFEQYYAVVSREYVEHTLMLWRPVTLTHILRVFSLQRFLTQ